MTPHALKKLHALSNHPNLHPGARKELNGMLLDHYAEKHLSEEHKQMVRGHHLKKAGPRKPDDYVPAESPKNQKLAAQMGLPKKRGYKVRLERDLNGNISTLHVDE